MSLNHFVASLAIVSCFLFSPSATAQLEEECLCLDTCPATSAKEEITNIKKPDLVLYAKGTRLGKVIYEKNTSITVKEAGTVQVAITEINALYDKGTCAGIADPSPCSVEAQDCADGTDCEATKLNVLLYGHGKAGFFFFERGTANQISNDGGAGEAAKVKFEEAVKGKIEHLTFVSCETGKGVVGNGFLTKLRRAIKADLVKGFTGPVEAQTGRADPPAQGIFLLDGDKKDVEVPIPTISEWGIASLCLVLLTGLTLKFRRALPNRA